MLRQNIKRKSIRLLSDLLSYFAIGCLLFFVLGFSNISNYEKPLLFAIVSMSCGILIGVAIFYIIIHFYPTIKTYKSKKGVSIIYPLTFSFAFISFWLVSYINNNSAEIVECKNFEIIEKIAAGTPSRAYFIRINNKSGLESLNFGKSFYSEHTVGDSINVCQVMGSLGFGFYKEGE